MRAKKLTVFWLKLTAFVCMLACVINGLGALFESSDDILQNSAALRHLPRNSVDVFWMGTSHMHYNIIPQLLYDEYGITSTMVSGNSIDLSQTYWQLLEALRTQQPRVIVLDLYTAAAPYSYWYVQNVLAVNARAHMKPGSNPYNTVTGVARWLPLGSPYKSAAIYEAWQRSGADGDAYFALTRLHSRYAELSRSHFAALRGENRLAKTFGYFYGANDLSEKSIRTLPYTREDALAYDTEGTLWTFTDEQLQQVELLPTFTDQLGKIIDLAADKDISLVLCTAPYMTNPAEEKLFAQVAAFAGQQDVPFVEADAVALNAPEYLRDIGHLNDEGARLYTAFWGDYLREHYALEDRRTSTDIRYAPWRESMGSHERQRTAMQLHALKSGLTDYLEAVSTLDQNYLVLLSAEGEVYEGFTEDDYLLLNESLGIPEAVLDEWYEMSFGTFDAVICNGKLLKSHYVPDGRTTELKWNLLGHAITFEGGDPENRRWYIEGESAGKTGVGMNIAVYSMIDHKLMDYQTFDMFNLALDE